MKLRPSRLCATPLLHHPNLNTVPFSLDGLDPAPNHIPALHRETYPDNRTPFRRRAARSSTLRAPNIVPGRYSPSRVAAPWMFPATEERHRHCRPSTRLGRCLRYTSLHWCGVRGSVTKSQHEATSQAQLRQDREGNSVRTTAAVPIKILIWDCAGGWSGLPPPAPILDPCPSVYIPRGENPTQ